MSDERVKLTTYFGERDRVDCRTLADELLAICERHRVSGVQCHVFVGEAQ